MYLIDTNIFLESLLEQQKVLLVNSFFQKVEASDIFITEFSIYSIGLVLVRQRKFETFDQFIDEVIKEVSVIRLEPKELKILNEIAAKYSLDFDDAYQYAAAMKYNLEIVSFDSDFDRTEKKRKTPEMILGDV